MGKIRRTKVVVETERLLYVRGRRGGAAAWCEGCGAAARMVGLDEAALASGESQREIVRRAEAGTLHFAESAGGVLLVCLDSLLRGAEFHNTNRKAEQSS